MHRHVKSTGMNHAKKCEEKGTDQCSVCNALFVKEKCYIINNWIEKFQLHFKFAEFG